MARKPATKQAQNGERSICLYFNQAQYVEIVSDSERFREHLDTIFPTQPESFPPHFQNGYTMKDIRHSKKLKLPIRRITLRNGDIYTVRPSFVLPYMVAKTDEVADALFLAKWAPLWALEQVFGIDTSKLYRLLLGRPAYHAATLAAIERLGDEEFERFGVGKDLGFVCEGQVLEHVVRPPRRPCDEQYAGSFDAKSEWFF